MAGSGRLSAPIAGDGVDLTCVDSSRNMLSRPAGEAGCSGRARARVVCGDVTRIDLGTRFKLIFIAFHSFEELASDTERRACLENVLPPSRRRGAGSSARPHDVATRLAGVGPGKGGRWRFEDPESGRELTLSVETACDETTGIVRGEETIAFADEDVPFLRLPLRFRLIRPDEFRSSRARYGVRRRVRAGRLHTDGVRGRASAARAVWSLLPRT